jgi:hypothetical protein
MRPINAQETEDLYPRDLIAALPEPVGYFGRAHGVWASRLRCGHTACGNGQVAQTGVSADRGMLVSAWRSKVVFRNGPLAEMKDLELLYAYTPAAP